MGFAMKRWIIFVLIAIFLSIPAVSGAAAGDLYDSGKATVFDLPFFQIPIGSTNSKADKEKKEGEEAKNGATKEKEKQDKKVDDALKKAWGE